SREFAMAKETKSQEHRQEHRIDQFFAGPSARTDRWQDLHDVAQAWTAGTRNRNDFEAVLGEVAIPEEFFAYPGPHLMAALQERVAADDPRAAAALTARIARALTTRSFRRSGGDWEDQDDDEGAVRDVLPPALGRSDPRRPYFETLIVTGVSTERWPVLSSEWRRLRRPLDAFVYEPVFVGSVEDAFCAVMLNYDIAAVVLNEGFVFRSRHDAPVLRTLTASLEKEYALHSDTSA